MLENTGVPECGGTYIIEDHPTVGILYSERQKTILLNLNSVLSSTIPRFKVSKIVTWNRTEFVCVANMQTRAQ